MIIDRTKYLIMCDHDNSELKQFQQQCLFEKNVPDGLKEIHILSKTFDNAIFQELKGNSRCESEATQHAMNHESHKDDEEDFSYFLDVQNDDLKIGVSIMEALMHGFNKIMNFRRNMGHNNDVEVMEYMTNTPMCY